MEVGSIGASAMELALMRHLGVRQRSLATVELDGLVGWGATGLAEANATPWGHVPNLGGLREALVM